MFGGGDGERDADKGDHVIASRRHEVGHEFFVDDIGVPFSDFRILCKLIRLCSWMHPSWPLECPKRGLPSLAAPRWLFGDEKYWSTSYDRAVLLVILASICSTPRGVLGGRTNHGGDHNLRSSWPQLEWPELETTEMLIHLKT